MGVSVEMVAGVLYSIPMIYIKNQIGKRISYCYGTFLASVFSIYWLAGACLHFALVQEFIFYPFSYISIIITGLILVVGSIILTIIFYIYYRKNKADQFSNAFLIEKSNALEINSTTMSTTSSMSGVNGLDDKTFIAKLRNYLIIIPLEFLVFIVTIMLIFMMTGIVNIFLYYRYSNSSQFNIVAVYFLPLLSLVTGTTMYIAYPEVTFNFIDANFFNRTRKIFGFYSKPTLASKIYANPNFTLARSALWGRSDVWKALSTENLSVKLLVLLYPDMIVLENETERAQVFEFDHLLNKKNYEVVRCCNGDLVVLDQKDLEQANTFDYKKLKVIYTQALSREKYSVGKFAALSSSQQYFFLYVYVSYTIFFAIPIFYNFFTQTFLCGTTGCFLGLFDDQVVAAITIIDYFFGFFILIPFVSAWQGITAFLEEMYEMCLLFEKKTVDEFTFKDTDEFIEKFTIERLKNWDRAFMHLQTVIFVKATFLKYIFIYAYFFAKILGVLFSLIALFITANIDAEILRVLFIVLVAELAVDRYLILPAALVSQESYRATNFLFACKKTIGKNLITLEGKLPKDQMDKLIAIKKYYDDVTTFWEDQSILGWMGYWFKLGFIRTTWGIMPSDISSSLTTFAFTLIPAIVTYIFHNYQPTQNSIL